MSMKVVEVQDSLEAHVKAANLQQVQCLLHDFVQHTGNATESVAESQSRALKLVQDKLEADRLQSLVSS